MEGEPQYLWGVLVSSLVLSVPALTGAMSGHQPPRVLHEGGISFDMMMVMVMVMLMMNCLLQQALE